MKQKLHRQNKLQLLLNSVMGAVFVLAVLLPSCGIKTEAINYGEDVCVYCSMTAIDKKFGAELINDKGKVLKFDCAECMIRFVKSDKGFVPSKLLVASYENHGELIDAEKAFYLSGGNVNSPMGGKLAAFNRREAAESAQKELNGDVLLWDKVKALNF